MGGRYININKLAEMEEMDHSYLSRILSGQRVAKVAYMQRIARALGMSFDDLMSAIEVRKDEIKEKWHKKFGQLTAPV